jgi:uncharacterized protein (TIGR03086 family)
MSAERAALTGGIALLERAINYTLGSLALVTPAALTRPTPCPKWDLRALVDHVDDGLLALCEAVECDGIDLDVSVAPPGDPVARLRARAARLLGAWAGADTGDLVRVSDHALTAAIVTTAGAIEIAVHGWDVARACGWHRPIPPSLAEELLDLAPLLVTAADRPARFGVPMNVLSGSPSDRLVAFLGRHPPGPAERRYLQTRAARLIATGRRIS